MTHPHDNPVRDALRALDQQRADTLADALRPDAAPTGDAAEVLRLREECARLRAIIAGRAAPPTDAEIAQHAAAGGSWLIAPRHYQPVAHRDVSIAKHYALMALDGDDALPMTWRALDATGRPCAWPVVDGGESREGEER